uniref:Uncharacterized protein n=1 Tax=Neolamprologus brichardi TaxID=32507 RepID=A0A3Q4HP33_NEOBR
SSMEDMYVKPGNQERGWNDPPQFSYGLQMNHGPQRNLLNKRPPPAPTSGTNSSDVPVDNQTALIGSRTFFRFTPHVSLVFAVSRGGRGGSYTHSSTGAEREGEREPGATTRDDMVTLERSNMSDTRKEAKSGPVSVLLTHKGRV